MPIPRPLWFYRNCVMVTTYPNKAFLSIDGNFVVPPVTGWKDGFIQRHDSCFDVATERARVLAKQIKEEGRVPKNSELEEIERSAFEVTWAYNQLIPRMVELEPSFAKGQGDEKAKPLPRKEVEQIAKSAVSYVMTIFHMLTFYSEDAEQRGDRTC